jgi:type II secretory pathway pseudopilin PulG
VVILIMSILVTLVTLGVTRAMRYASEVGTKTEMAQIEQALGVAALDLGRVPYIPSYLVLKKKPTGYGSTPWEAMSKRLLQQMFPNWDGSKDAGWGDRTLDATQAFVFILGGRNCIEGFNASDADPFADINSTKKQKKKGPYFNFKSERLDPASYTYKDYWNNNGGLLVVYSSQMVAGGTFPSGETPSGYPTRQTIKTGTIYMPKGYQIFSAGKDGLWGTAGYGVASFNGLLQSPGDDDQCNFSESPLGKPIND